MFSMRVVALMAAMLLASRTALCQEKCTEDNKDTYYCQDCKTGMHCGAAETDPEQYSICTKPNEACAMKVGLPICVPLADSPCSCDKPQQCDAYDDGALFVCLNGGSTTIVSPCVTPGPTCLNDVCTDGTVPDGPCEVDVDGFVPITPECISGAYCTGGKPVGTVNCSAGEYFDPYAGNCAPGPLESCDGSCMGICPDKTNCSRYYVCDTSSHGYLQDCPEDTPLFDTVSNTCMLDDPANPPTCTKTDGCVFDGTTTSPLVSPITTTTSEGGIGSTTTAATTTTDGSVTPMPPQCNESNVNHRYPNEENCKMYVLCALVAPGQYEYLNMTCPGNYVYNPSTTYCDYPENVPGCVVPTAIALHDIDTSDER